MAKKKLPAPQNLLVPALLILLVISAFMVGSLWTKVQYLEKNGVAVKGSQEQGAGSGAPQDPFQAVKASDLNIPPVTEDDRIKGAKDAKLTWVEYSDLECPFCQRIHTDLQKMVEEYDGQVRWVYRHFPLDTIHPKARKEAEAAECATEQGGNDAFWAYIDQVFTVTPSNNNLDPSQLPKIAASVGLNRSQFQSCLDSGKYANRVQDQLAGGEKAGVAGTPGNFLLDDKGNAWVISGAVPFPTIKQFIDQALTL